MSNPNQTTYPNQTDTEKKSDRRMLTGMFADRDSAERAYNTLHERGYTKDDINLIMSDDTRKKYYSNDAVKTDLGTKAAKQL